MNRHVVVGLAVLALVVELGWLVFAAGSVGSITAAVLASIALLTVTAARVVAINTVVRILLGALFAGSVADRFGLLGAPGASGVSWGSYSAFTDYTRSLVPEVLDWSAPTLAAIATVLETLCGIGLILGIAARTTARVATALLIGFAAAMWTSVGFDEMCSYGVLVVAGGAALLGTGDTAWNLDHMFRRRTLPSPAVQ
ncbi:TQO small subunit DoxD [Nocardia sp. CA-107356]|uniref:TQO small subunit DoxD n=1 Tax=Nocardia sp. CA-107356 TaxID=3239972 RepID=UPI003D90F0EC